MCWTDSKFPVTARYPWILTYSFQEPPNYQFKYEVKDEYTGQDFGQEEARSGYNTDGEYQVLLPDGRRQIVTYRIDDPESGFVADVRYEGEAKEYHYEPKPASYQPKPAYRAIEPVYQPRPVYKPTPAPYKPKPVYTPAPYKPSPAPYKAPEYLPTPAPYQAPQYSTESYVRSPKARQYVTTQAPVYEPVTTTYRPAYDPRPTYKPEPTYVSTTHKPTEPRPYRPTSPKARQNVPEYEASEASEAPEETTTTTEAPIYDPSNTEKRRMRYPKKLKISSDRQLHDSLFYGNVKGRVRAPVRRKVENSELENWKTHHDLVMWYEPSHLFSSSFELIFTTFHLHPRKMSLWSWSSKMAAFGNIKIAHGGFWMTLYPSWCKINTQKLFLMNDFPYYLLLFMTTYLLLPSALDTLCHLNYNKVLNVEETIVNRIKTTTKKYFPGTFVFFPYYFRSPTMAVNLVVFIRLFEPENFHFGLYCGVYTYSSFTTRDKKS